ncbi:hypothetical protein CN116_10620 [Sinorhizobium meliloti]|nr:hypothetical protein CN125_07600 [Sinorhizobium meliloti]RVM42138.1 hypothetical protein CN121_27620 [Sinorhizobium meliloti]RVM68842.1 hypothetical protein CN124_09165 [Sinorhizobium meliloti]RVM72740.1 hypothetical protein CN123_03845 [Sinorhizobium meliloti]RVM80917.1 hypothetical protein CN117_23885 [Sinorhizobium meliloti]
MLKVFSILKRPGASSESVRGLASDWMRDPLQHPDLSRMDERELADLPFPGWPWPRSATENLCVQR